MLDPLVFGSGTIQVPEHLLRPGATQRPPDQGRAIQIDAGECGSEVRVRLILEATEVDFFVDDHGSNVLVVPVNCPAAGGEPTTIEAEILRGL